MDDDRRVESPVIKTESRSGSTLTVPPHLPDPGINEHIAKKKRAMFQVMFYFCFYDMQCDGIARKLSVILQGVS